MSTFDTAYLPGVGFLVDPQPEDYRRAVRFLQDRFSPVRPSRRGRPPSGRDLCDRLSATVRRLEWTPKRTHREQTQAFIKRSKHWRSERTGSESVP